MAEVMLVGFADDIKLGGKTKALERGLPSRGTWVGQRKVGRALCSSASRKALPPGSQSLRQQCRLDMACLGSSSAEKASGLAATKAAVSITTVVQALIAVQYNQEMEESDGSPLIQHQDKILSPRCGLPAAGLAKLVWAQHRPTWMLRDWSTCTVRWPWRTGLPQPREREASRAPESSSLLPMDRLLTIESWWLNDIHQAQAERQ